MTSFFTQTALELTAAALLILGLLFEDRLADFEEAVFLRIKRRLRIGAGKPQNHRL